MATLTWNLGRGARAVPDDRALEVLVSRPLDHIVFPIVEIEASYHKRHRVDGEVVYDTIVTISGEDGEGDYEALGIDIGDSENLEFWTRVFLVLKARGLSGVETVISEPHGGLEEALHRIFPDARWQRAEVELPPDPAAPPSASGRHSAAIERADEQIDEIDTLLEDAPWPDRPNPPRI